MRESNLSTPGHIRRECHHPNLWQRLAFFPRYIYIIVQNNRFFLSFPSTNSFVEKIFFTRIKHFVITGNLDNVTCFHCDIGLRDWVRVDNAFAEHARWSPYCVYVTFVKGKPFIDGCRRIARQNGTGDILTVTLNE